MSRNLPSKGIGFRREQLVLWRLSGCRRSFGRSAGAGARIRLAVLDELFVVLLETGHDAQVGLTLGTVIVGLAAQRAALAVDRVPAIVAAERRSDPLDGTVSVPRRRSGRRRRRARIGYGTAQIVLHSGLQPVPSHGTGARAVGIAVGRRVDASRNLQRVQTGASRPTARLAGISRQFRFGVVQFQGVQGNDAQDGRKRIDDDRRRSADRSDGHGRNICRYEGERLNDRRTAAAAAAAASCYRETLTGQDWLRSLSGQAVG